MLHPVSDDAGPRAARAVPRLDLFHCAELRRWPRLCSGANPAPAPKTVRETRHAARSLRRALRCVSPGRRGGDRRDVPATGRKPGCDRPGLRCGGVVEDGQEGPIEVLGVAYDGSMPAVSALSGPDLDAVVDYVVVLAGGEVADAPPPVSGPASGDADRGRDLFIGANRFDEGGAACSSCHTAGDVGNSGDAASALTSMTCIPDSEARPASADGSPTHRRRPWHRSSLITRSTKARSPTSSRFLAEAPDREEGSVATDWLVVAGLGGLMVLLAGMALAWRQVRQTYAQTLRSRR